MRLHILIWLAAMLVFAAAVLLWLDRRALRDGEIEVLTPRERVQRAIELLELDPSAAELATQNAVRAAAVEAEAGRVLSARGDYVLALQYQREFNLAAAETYYKSAIARSPDWALAHAALGNLLGRHLYGRTNEAIRQLERAIELAPEWGRPYDLLAVVLRGAGRLEEAEDAAQRAIELDPDNVAHHNNYANLLKVLGRYKDAEVEYREALRLDPENAKPYYNIACLYALMKKRNEAIDYLRLAIERAPNLRAEAAIDDDFESLRNLKAFKQLLSAPAKPEDARKTSP